MNKPSLTLVEIAEMADGANTELPDGLYRAAPNLYVQIRGESASYVLRWYRGSHVSTMGLGSLRKVTFDEAKRQAAKCLDLVRSGTDPRLVYRAEKAASKSGAPTPLTMSPPSSVPTFRQAARDYLALHEARLKSHDHWWRSLKTFAFPVIEEVPVDQLTVNHMLAILQPVWHDKHPTAIKLRTQIAKVIDWVLAEHGIDMANPAKAGSLVIRLGGPANHHPTHHRAISYTQAPAFWSAIEDSVAGDVVRFMTLTAARPSEALGAQWEHIDLDQRVWTIPGDAMKKGREHRVPLSDAAVEVLERHYDGQTSGLVFPNPRGKPMDRSVPRRLVKRMGYNATAHGMRSTFADWCREVAKADAEARELALAHQIGNATTRAYARSDLLEPRRELMQQWADFLTG